MKLTKFKLFTIIGAITAASLVALPFMLSSSSSVENVTENEKEANVDYAPVGGEPNTDLGYINIEFTKINSYGFEYRIKGKQSDYADQETFGWVHTSHSPSDSHGTPVLIDPIHYKVLPANPDMNTWSPLVSFDYLDAGGVQKYVFASSTQYALGHYSSATLDGNTGTPMTYSKVDLANFTIGGLDSVAPVLNISPTSDTSALGFDITFNFLAPTANWLGLLDVGQSSNVMTPTWNDGIVHSVKVVDSVSGASWVEEETIVFDYQNYTTPVLKITNPLFSSGHAYDLIVDIDGDGDYQTTPGIDNVEGGIDQLDYLQNVTTFGNEANVANIVPISVSSFSEKFEFTWSGDTDAIVSYEIYKYDTTTSTTDWASGTQGTNKQPISVTGGDYTKVYTTDEVQGLDYDSWYVAYFSFSPYSLPTDDLTVNTYTPSVVFKTDVLSPYTTSTGVVGQSVPDDNSTTDKTDALGYNQFQLHYQIFSQAADIFVGQDIYWKIVNQGEDSSAAAIYGYEGSQILNATGEGTVNISAPMLSLGQTYDIWLSLADPTYSDPNTLGMVSFTTDTALTVNTTSYDFSNYIGITNSIQLDIDWNSNQTGSIWYSVNYGSTTTSNTNWTKISNVTKDTKQIVVSVPEGQQINSVTLSMYDPNDLSTHPIGYAPVTVEINNLLTTYSIASMNILKEDTYDSGNMRVEITYNNVITTTTKEVLNLYNEQNEIIYAGEIVIDPNNSKISTDDNKTFVIDLKETTPYEGYVWDDYESDKIVNDNTVLRGGIYTVEIIKTNYKLQNSNQYASTQYGYPGAYSPTQNSNIWAWIILALVILGLIGFMYLRWGKEIVEWAYAIFKLAPKKAEANAHQSEPTQEFSEEVLLTTTTTKPKPKSSPRMILPIDSAAATSFNLSQVTDSEKTKSSVDFKSKTAQGMSVDLAAIELEKKEVEMFKPVDGIAIDLAHIESTKTESKTLEPIDGDIVDLSQYRGGKPKKQKQVTNVVMNLDRITEGSEKKKRKEVINVVSDLSAPFEETTKAKKHKEVLNRVAHLTMEFDNDLIKK